MSDNEQNNPNPVWAEAPTPPMFDPAYLAQPMAPPIAQPMAQPMAQSMAQPIIQPVLQPNSDQAPTPPALDPAYMDQILGQPDPMAQLYLQHYWDAQARAQPMMNHLVWPMLHPMGQPSAQLQEQGDSAQVPIAAMAGLMIQPGDQPKVHPGEEPVDQPVDHSEVKPELQVMVHPENQLEIQQKLQPEDQFEIQQKLQPEEEPINQAGDHPEVQLMVRPENQPEDHPVVQLMVLPEEQPEDHHEVQLMAHPENQPEDHPKYQPEFQTMVHLKDQPNVQSDEDDDDDGKPKYRDYFPEFNNDSITTFVRVDYDEPAAKKGSFPLSIDTTHFDEANGERIVYPVRITDDSPPPGRRQNGDLSSSSNDERRASPEEETSGVRPYVTHYLNEQMNRLRNHIAAHPDGEVGGPNQPAAARNLEASLGGATGSGFNGIGETGIALPDLDPLEHEPAASFQNLTEMTFIHAFGCRDHNCVYVGCYKAGWLMVHIDECRALAICPKCCIFYQRTYEHSRRCRNDPCTCVENCMRYREMLKRKYQR